VLYVNNFNMKKIHRKSKAYLADKDMSTTIFLSSNKRHSIRQRLITKNANRTFKKSMRQQSKQIIINELSIIN